MYSWGNHSWATLRWRSTRRPTSGSSSGRGRERGRGETSRGLPARSRSSLQRLRPLLHRPSGWSRRPDHPSRRGDRSELGCSRRNLCARRRLQGPLPRRRGRLIEAKDGVSLETTTTIDSLTNGVAYQCEVAASRLDDGWRVGARSITVMPIGQPAAPGKPTVEALDRSVRSRRAGGRGGRTGYRLQCSDDGGNTWNEEVDSRDMRYRRVQGNDLTNMVSYVCRGMPRMRRAERGIARLRMPSCPADRSSSAIRCSSRSSPCSRSCWPAGLLIAFVALVRERRRVADMWSPWSTSSTAPILGMDRASGSTSSATRSANE